jgi:tetratricopeptide (TPR) repeat protein
MYVQKPRLWDAAKGVELGTLHRSGAMSEFYFNPSGDRLVIDTGSGVELVDAINGASIAGVDGFQLESNGFSADGALAALSDWSEVEIWDTLDGQLLTTLTHNTKVRAVAFSPDKKLLATATDYAIRLWHIDESYLVDLACDLAHRNMTYEEWVGVLGDQPYRKTCPEWPVHPSVHEAAAEMAGMGNEEGARALYEHIRELEADFTAQDARLAFNEARAQGLVNDAAALADAGRIAEALENYEQARNLTTVFVVDDRLWMDVCYYGALQGQTLEIIDACDKAVDLFSNRMDSFGQRAFEGRAILRAQLGEYEDAEEDLQIVVDALSSTSTLLPTRMEWLEQLQDGKNPFEQESLGEIEVICPSC